MRNFIITLSLLSCSGDTPSNTAEKAQSQQPNVVIITLDTTRADRLGFYGDPLARTPNLDRFAEDAVVFREAFTPVPLTLPAHASLLSGWYPSRHGVRDNGGYRVAKDVPLIQEELKAAGYHTGAFVASYVLDGAWGLERGFDRYFDDFHPEDVRKADRFGAVERPAREVIREALAWWEAPERAGHPKMMWVHLFDAHTPYEPPADWKGDPYRGEIFGVDRALRPLLSSLTGDEMVIITADHGENLWDGQELEHGVVLTRSTTRIPLVIHPPGGVEGTEAPPPRSLPARPSNWRPVDGLSPPGLVLDVVPDAPTGGRVVSTPVSLVDLAPTIRDVVGLPAQGGRSLQPALEGRALAPQPVYSESVAPFTHYGWAPQHVARDDSRLVRRDVVDEVFDVQADPWWQGPLTDPPPEALKAALFTFSQGWESPGGAIDPQTAAALEALGYATAQVSAPTEGLVSARSKITGLHQLLLAQGVIKSNPDAALASLRALVTEQPSLVDAWFSIAALEQSQGDREGALRSIEQILVFSPDHSIANNNRVVLLRDAGRMDEALTSARALASRHPADARWHRHVVDILGRKEAPREVAAAAEAGLSQVGEDPYLLYMLGLARLQVDDPSGAIQALERSRAAGTLAHDLGLWLGVAHQKLGQVDEAVEAWKKQANLTPDDPRALIQAALLLVENDRCGDAMPLLMTATQRRVRDARVQEAIKSCTGR